MAVEFLSIGTGRDAELHIRTDMMGLEALLGALKGAVSTAGTPHFMPQAPGPNGLSPDAFVKVAFTFVEPGRDDPQQQPKLRLAPEPADAFPLRIW